MARQTDMLISIPRRTRKNWNTVENSTVIPFLGLKPNIQMQQLLRIYRIGIVQKKEKIAIQLNFFFGGRFFFEEIR